MSAKVSFPALTSTTVLFVNKDAANTFFNSGSVPSADNNTEGTVKKAVALNYASPVGLLAVGNIVPVLKADGTTENLEVCTQANYVALVNAFNALASSYATLVLNLKNAGIIS